MIRKSPIKKTTQFSLNSVPLRELVVTLDEQDEESLSAGSFPDRVQTTLESRSSPVVALVLLFANPFA
jgi:hypothetical protein